jgi:zinc transport system substrate-binding protein
MLHKRVLILGAALLLPWSVHTAPVGPQGTRQDDGGSAGVTASIKPVHSLVAGVMEGVAMPVLLMKGAASPHSYSLRPSGARSLSRSRLVFWVGRKLEGFLEKPLRALSGGARVVALGGAPGVRLSVVEEGHGAPAGTDPHFWLDPRNARAAVRVIADALAEAHPRHAQAYRRNARGLDARLEALDKRLQAMLAPVRARPYAVFHDGYRYFEQRYGLRNVGAVAATPQHKPGVKRIAALRARIRRLGAVCVFAEPQFRPHLIETVVEGSRAKVGMLDPLGMDIEPGPELYFRLMERLASAMVECLSGAS